MDSLYLHSKLAKPMSYDLWYVSMRHKRDITQIPTRVDVRSLVDYTCEAWDQPDMSIVSGTSSQKAC